MRLEAIPLWKSVPAALRRFFLFKSLPRTLFSTCWIMFGMHSRIGIPERPIAVTFSISEDQALLWFRLARAALGERFDFAIFDSAGDFDPVLFPGARVVRLANFYHGTKIDIAIRHVLGAETVFLCDDDKYPLTDLSSELSMLRDPGTAAVSLCPRRSHVLRIGGADHAPMGSYALLFKRSVFSLPQFHFSSPRRAISPYRHFPDPSVKIQRGYDTGDRANELLLRAGYAVSHASGAVGFDGLSAPRILSRICGADAVLRALRAVFHCRQGSVNGSVMRGAYGLAAFESVFRAAFGRSPRFSTGFRRKGLRSAVLANSFLSPEDRGIITEYFDSIDRICHTLTERARRGS